MRIALLPLLGLLLLTQASLAQMPPETPGTATLPEPTPAWFLVRSVQGAYVFDADSGEMQGEITNENAFYTPAIVTVPARKEAYMVESFYARAVRGERSDVVTVVDMGNLTTKTEIDIPDHAAALGFRHHIAIMGDDRHLAVFNQSPAQSVSIVDVVDRQFDGEIPTPGCAIMMPTGERAFMMICADGRLQLIELDENGKEAGRSRSDAFFSVDKDAVFDQPMKSAEGWVLVSREGLVYEVSVDGSRMRIGKPWSMLSEKDLAADADKRWRPGGRQVFAINRATNLLYVLMHEGPIDTHVQNGTEVWVVDLGRDRRIGRLKLKVPGSHILASQQEHPRLYLADEKRRVHVYDGIQLKKLRTIRQPAPELFMLQTLSQYD